MNGGDTVHELLGNLVLLGGACMRNRTLEVVDCRQEILHETLAGTLALDCALAVHATTVVVPIGLEP